MFPSLFMAHHYAPLLQSERAKDFEKTYPNIYKELLIWENLPKYLQSRVYNCRYFGKFSQLLWSGSTH